MTDFDERAARAADRLRRRAAEIADRAEPLATRSGTRSDRAVPRRRWIAAVAAGVLLVGGVAALVLVADDDSPGVLTDDGTAPTDRTTPTAPEAVGTLPPIVTTVPVTIASGSTATGSTPDSTTPTSATTPPTEPAVTPAPLLRPIIDPSICVPISAREGPTFQPFGPLTLFSRSSEFPVPIQIIGHAEQGPAGPFAIVLRYLDSSRPISGDITDVNGVTVGISMNPNGNGEAMWILPDGSQGYLRSRGLSRDEVVAIVAALSPRPSDAAIPGFDYSGSSGVDPGLSAPELLHERMNTEVSEGTTSGSQCRVPGTVEGGGTVGYSVSTLVGDPVYVFGGVIDRPAPLSVAERHGTVLVIAGPDLPDAPTVDDVIEADETLWNDLRTTEVPGGPRVEPIGGDLEVTADLVTFAGGDGGHLTFKLKEFEGVTFLEVYQDAAVVSPDGVYWVEEINGRRRSMSSAPGGGVAGTRLGDSPITEPFTVEVFVIDSDDLVLQTTGEIMLVPQT